MRLLHFAAALLRALMLKYYNRTYASLGYDVAGAVVRHMIAGPFSSWLSRRWRPCKVFAGGGFSVRAEHLITTRVVGR